ncbi:aminotransferase class I/II-fold pyridoxal phosphate-dependent enzyme [Ancylobacter sp. TS-1]|uniref:MocR-like pyridoxine biosynthesis transcription factor PdxR n=1 Tax=Ancylobacter sp. TS-1 TaxID=1850374 RepID=UPI001390DEBF|nr:aminotransferase class I/II-fold pyridoxal phosphate-dependent enzyme [Ancylobacter sp. TS-1]
MSARNAIGGTEEAGARSYAAQIPILVDRSRPDGLTRQIADQIREGIETGRVAVGTRLPSSRRLSEQLNVARNTVVRAYEMLEDQGLIETRPASGIFARRPATQVPAPTVPLPEPPGDRPAMPRPQAPARVQRLVNDGAGRLSFDFFPGRPDAGLFPIKTWRRLIQSTLSRGAAPGLVQYSDPAGLPVLRAAIAGHLATWRGIAPDPGRVIVTHGIQEGLSIAARLFLGPDAAAVVENPCYQGASFAFEATGARIERVPVDEEGLMVERLPAGPVALAYVTPSHQYPTGASLALHRRHGLVDWARRTGAYLVEDDYDSDFQYDGSPLPAIAAMAPDCTLYLGTFSKSLGAGLRLGYMVVPPALVDAAIAVKTLLNNGGSWLEQSVLAEFIRSGGFVSHLMRARARYRESRDVTLAALRRHFGDVEVEGEASGLHLCWQLPSGLPAAATLETMARKARVGVYSLASGGAHDGLGTSLSMRGIVLGYASLSPRQIEQGIARLSDVVDDTLDARPTFLSELLVHEPLGRGRRPEPAPRNRQRPALRAAPPRPAVFGPEQFLEGPMQLVRGIYRYPIKGLSGQPVAGVELEPGRPFPFDRVFALARPGVPVDPYDPQWAKKGLFVMLMLDEALAQVRTSLDPETLLLRVWSGTDEVLCVGLDTPSGRAEFEAFVHRLVPSLNEPPTLVQSRTGHFMDKPDNVLSLINLATVRSLEEKWGRAIDPLRFRANFYVDGLRPWQEFEWIGSDIRLGDAVFRVDRRNGRCGATNVNPANGQRDLDIPGGLRTAFGHKDLGVYLVTQKGGKVVVGDPFAVPSVAAAAPSTPAPAAAPGVSTPAIRQFICRGCYYIFDEAKGHRPDGIVPGTPFAAVPAGWRCPDCGTDKIAFRPYLPA